MSKQSFFENPILNASYVFPQRHWEMDAENKPTGKIVERRRESSNRTPMAAAIFERRCGARCHGAGRYRACFLYAHYVGMLKKPEG